MKRIIISFLLFVSFSSGESYAQDSLGIKLQHHFFAELGGATIIGLSVNYELQFHLKNTDFICARIGGGFTPDVFGGDAYPNYNAGLNYDLGNKRSFWETGIGISYLQAETKKYSHNFFLLNTGYRFQAKNEGLTFRTGLQYFNELYETEDDNSDLHVLPYLSVGVKF